MAAEVDSIATNYAGTRKALLRLGFKTSVLTVLTLGFYRFWMKTRLRRFYWSAIRPGGLPLEYTGTGAEKFMGFLIAVVFLAFYIGVFNLILMFLSFTLVNSNFLGYGLSFVGLIPIIFFARYRARRYLLARTRWRGLRFGVEQAAWAYALRAMGHWTLTLITLGIALPRQTFWLEKFRTDRTWYGDARFTQGGSSTMLFGKMKLFYIGLGFLALGGFLAYAGENIGFLLVIIGIPLMAIGLVYFQVNAFRIMAQHKRLGDDISFHAQPRTGRVIGIYLLGNFLVYVTLLTLLSVAIALFALTFQSAFTNPDFLEGLSSLPAASRLTSIIAAVIFYFVFFVLWGVLSQIFVTLPTMRHYARTTRILNASKLANIRQRPRDESTGAEGFAEALDVGAAI